MLPLLIIHICHSQHITLWMYDFLFIYYDQKLFVKNTYVFLFKELSNHKAQVLFILYNYALIQIHSILIDSIKLFYRNYKFLNKLDKSEGLHSLNIIIFATMPLHII